MQALEVAALAFPVADRVVDEFQLRYFAEILDREHGLENRLQPGVIALAGQAIHLQEAVITALLHLDQVRNLDGRRNLGKIKTLTESVVLPSRHEKLLSSASGGIGPPLSIAPNPPGGGAEAAQRKTAAPSGTSFPVGAACGTSAI